MPAGMQTERARLAGQLESGLFRRAAPFAVIAAMAAGHQIFPRRLAGARTRDHVIERQLPGRQYLQAVLASIPVAHQDILARESAGLVRDTAVFQEPDDRRYS